MHEWNANLAYSPWSVIIMEKMTHRLWNSTFVSDILLPSYATEGGTIALGFSAE